MSQRLSWAFPVKNIGGVTDCIALASSGRGKHHSLLATGPYRDCRDMSTAFSNVRGGRGGSLSAQKD